MMTKNIALIREVKPLTVSADLIRISIFCAIPYQSQS